jgi:hypothetical protein
MVSALEPFVSFMLWLALLAWIVSPAAAYFIARQKGLSPLSWAAGAVLFGPFALLAIELAPAGERPSGSSASGLEECPYCGESTQPEAMVCRHCGRSLPEREHDDR